MFTRLAEMTHPAFILLLKRSEDEKGTFHVATEKRQMAMGNNRGVDYEGVKDCDRTEQHSEHDERSVSQLNVYIPHSYLSHSTTLKLLL
jgi:hypothetical protein